MNAMNCKKLSGNELSELCDLMSRIDGLIAKDYCHVSDNLPLNFRNEVVRIQDRLGAEINRRENSL